MQHFKHVNSTAAHVLVTNGDGEYATWLPAKTTITLRPALQVLISGLKWTYLTGSRLICDKWLASDWYLHHHFNWVDIWFQSNPQLFWVLNISMYIGVELTLTWHDHWHSTKCGPCEYFHETTIATTERRCQSDSWRLVRPRVRMLLCTQSSFSSTDVYCSYWSGRQKRQYQWPVYCAMFLDGQSHT